MFSYLKGVVADINENIMTLEVGGVGYELVVSAMCLSDNQTLGKDAKIHTYMSVREDGISLFGFSSKVEKGMFLRLISVSGIGPKVAIGILSSISVNDLAEAVATSDALRLSTVKGVGKKTAERIILELKDKIKMEIGAVVSSGTGQKVLNVNDLNNDAVAALVSLGYSKNEAATAVSKLVQDGMTTEEIVFKVLKGK